MKCHNCNSKLRIVITGKQKVLYCRKCKLYFPLTSWNPTKKEKKKIESICSKCIGLMGDLPIEQSAFALRCLVDSFNDISGIKIKDVIIK